MPRRCIRRGPSLHVPLQFSHKAAPRTVALLAWEPQGEIVQLRCQKCQLFGGTWQGTGHLPQVLIKCSLVTQAHRLPPPCPQSSGHSQHLADICGQMVPCVVSIYPPKGTTAYPAAGRVTWEAAWDSGPLTSTWPLLPQGSPKHTGFEGACGLRTCGQWASGGLVQDAGRKVRRRVTHVPHGPITPPPTHLLPRALSGHVSQRHEAALDTGAVHTKKRLDGVLGKQPWSPICLPSQFRPAGCRAVALASWRQSQLLCVSAPHCCDWEGSVHSGA